MNTDRLVVRLVVAGLILLATVALLGGLILTMSSHTVPDFVVAIGTTCVGAVAGILAKTSTETPVVAADTARVAVDTTDVPVKSHGRSRPVNEP